MQYSELCRNAKRLAEKTSPPARVNKQQIMAPVQQSFSYKLLSVPVPKYIGHYKSSLIDLKAEVVIN